MPQVPHISLLAWQALDKPCLADAPLIGLHRHHFTGRRAELWRTSAWTRRRGALSRFGNVPLHERAGDRACTTKRALGELRKPAAYLVRACLPEIAVPESTADLVDMAATAAPG